MNKAIYEKEKQVYKEAIDYTSDESGTVVGDKTSVGNNTLVHGNESMDRRMVIACPLLIHQKST